MEIRRGWPAMSDAKKIELQNIINMLQKLMPFELVILYGQYASGRMRSERGGYELLLVTRGTREKEGWELERQLNRMYAYEIREESRLHLETADINAINRIQSRSWFYLNIRNEGYLLLGETTQSVFTGKGVKSTQAYNAACKNFDRYYHAGSGFLTAAERAWDEKLPHVAAIQFSYAALLLFRALEATFYGNHIKTANPMYSFKRIRHFSKALLSEFSLAEPANRRFFLDIDALCRYACDEPEFSLTAKRYYAFSGRLQTLRQIVARSAQAHIAYLERCKDNPGQKSPQE